MKLNQKRITNVKRVIFLMRDSGETFYWGDQRKGFEFWEDFCKELERILEDNDDNKDKVCKECGSKLE